MFLHGRSGVRRQFWWQLVASSSVARCSPCGLPWDVVKRLMVGNPVTYAAYGKWRTRIENQCSLYSAWWKLSAPCVVHLFRKFVHFDGEKNDQPSSMSGTLVLNTFSDRASWTSRSESVSEPTDCLNKSRARSQPWPQFPSICLTEESVKNLKNRHLSGVR